MTRPQTTITKIRTNSYIGSYPTLEDFEQIRDKVNEIIDIINKGEQK